MSTTGSIPGEHRDVQGNRRARAQELFERGAFERISSDVFVVENPKTRGVYEVDLGKVSCSCEDFHRYKHIPAFVCKHIGAARMYQNWLKGVARDLAPYFGRVA